MSFAEEIEQMCRDGVEYIDAVIEWCGKNNIEIEHAAAMIKKDVNLKSKIQLEAENMNIIKKTARLPI